MELQPFEQRSPFFSNHIQIAIRIIGTGESEHIGAVIDGQHFIADCRTCPSKREHGLRFVLFDPFDLLPLETLDSGKKNAKIWLQIIRKDQK